MDKTTFLIKEMDCPSEEQMVRLKLSDIVAVKNLKFDLSNRILMVSHMGDLDKITAAINSLSLGSNIIETTNCDDSIESSDNFVKKILWIVLIINSSFFILEATVGLIGNSIGLIADSFDMLADAFVYGLSLYAILGTLRIKKMIAKISGFIQLIIACAGFVEIFRRFIIAEVVPNPMLMILVSFFALIANSISLLLLNKSKNDEVHIKSSQIFTSNDIIVNIGVIFAGLFVFLLNSQVPDLVIGFIVLLIVLKGAFRIISLSK